MLTERQRTHYIEHGWLAVPGLVDAAWLDRLRAVTEEFVEQSRALTESNVIFDLDTGHSADEPRLRRLSSPTDLHETYWSFSSTSPIVDVVTDLIGPDVKFHHSKLNFKAAHGGEEVKWHQDIQFWPHTNYDLLTIGVFLEDVEAGMGEVGFVSGSHDGPLFDLYDGDDVGRCARRSRPAARGCGARRRIRPVPPARSPFTTAARCTGRRPIAPTGRGRCCSRPTPRPTRTRTPIS